MDLDVIYNEEEKLIFHFYFTRFRLKHAIIDKPDVSQHAHDHQQSDEKTTSTAGSVFAFLHRSSGSWEISVSWWGVGEVRVFIDVIVIVGSRGRGDALRTSGGVPITVFRNKGRLSRFGGVRSRFKQHGRSFSPILQTIDIVIGHAKK